MGFFSKTDDTDRFAPDLLDQIPLGVSVYRLDEPGDPTSFRLVYSNAASARMTGLRVQDEVGRLLVDVLPEIAQTDVLERYAEVVRTGKPAGLGLVRYGDERIEERTFEVHAHPLSGPTVGVVFEDVTERSELTALRATQTELVREEARYRSLVEAAAAIVWTTPTSGEFVDVPERWLAITGQTRDEASGRGWLDVVHPEDRDATAAAWRRAVEGAGAYEVEHRLRHADGTYRRMAARATPVRDEAGEVVEWVGVHTDVEEQSAAAAELAASESRFGTLFDAIGDVVLVYPLGPDGPEPFLLVNEAAIGTYGYTRDELHTMTAEDLVAPNRLDVEAALSELRRTRRATFDSLHVAKDGRRIPMSTSARLIEYDGRLCVLALCRDDTERRQFRRALSRDNHKLERAVAERTAQLEGFAEDLKILHSITTALHPTPEARYHAYLQAGCEMFDLPIGILSSTPTDRQTGEELYRLEAVVAPDPEIQAGLTMPLSEAFCDAVIARGETVVYADAAEETPDHPACVGRGLRAFIGTPIVIEGETVGTLNFVSPEPRRDGFSASEKELVEVMADAVARRLTLDRIETAEAEAQERYRTIVETVEAGVLVVDADAQILMSNPSARELIGLDADDAERETDNLPARWPVVDAEGQRILAADLPEREVLRTGEPVRGHFQGIVPPGQPTRWYRVNATPIDQDRDGVPEVVVVSFEEVTDLHEAKLAAERTGALLRAVLAASPDGVMAFRAVRDEAGAVADFVWLLVNPRAEEIVGHPAADLVGERLLDVFPGNRDAGLFDAYARVVDTGETFQTVVPYAFDGFETSFRVVASAVPDEDSFTVTFLDVVDAEALPVREELFPFGDGGTA